MKNDINYQVSPRGGDYASRPTCKKKPVKKKPVNKKPVKENL